MRHLKALLGCAVAAVVLSGAGCSIESLEPRAVAMGVGRLTVQNTALVTSAVSTDTKCGFASPDVIKNVVVSGAAGTIGSAVFTINSCKLDFGQRHTVSKDCKGTATDMEGAITVSGTQTITGTVTGDPNNPVIPNDSNAIRMDLKTTLDGYTSRVGGTNPALTFKSGNLSWVAKPHVAVSASLGVCAVPTNNLTLEEITYDTATVHINDGQGHDFDADVETSRFSAQAGKWQDQENALNGNITVFGKAIGVPTAADKDGLDPKYNAEDFVATYACNSDLTNPISYTCPSVASAEAQGAARLSVNAVGLLTSNIEANTNCGFSNANVLAHPQLTGTVGERNGTATYSVSACTVSFPTASAVYTDCNNAATQMTGSYTVQGTKTLHGILTGDPSTPIIPIDSTPAVYTLRFDMNNLTVQDLPTRSITYANGSLSATLHPHTAQDTTTGACSMPTLTVGFENLNLQGSDVSILNGTTKLNLHVGSSVVNAQSGSGGGKENELDGTMQVNDNSVTLPDGINAVLDPTYSPGAFEARYSCTANLHIPQAESECSMYQVLGENAARLMVQTGVFAAYASNRDSHAPWDDGNCGFNSYPKKLTPSDVEGKSGQEGSMTWSIKSCEVATTEGVDVAPADCDGVRRVIQGSAKTTGTFHVTGVRYKEFLVIDSIRPDAYTSVTFDLTNIVMNNLSAYTLNAGQTVPDNKLTFVSGNLNTNTSPLVSSEADAKNPTYDIPTPLTVVRSVNITNAKAILQSGAKTFNLTIPSATITGALSGGFQGKANWLSGSVSFDAQTVSFTNIPLDPSFKQASFDASYACEPNLSGIIPSN